MWLYLALLGAGLAAFYYYRKWAAGGVCTATADLTDKIVIITGGNAGIGYQTAKGLLRVNAHVVLACRDESKGKAAVLALKKETGKKSVELMKLDLSSLTSVRTFVKNFKENHPALHILINNAGVMMTPQSETEDGFETKSGPGGRIVNVSSKASIRKVATIQFADIHMKKNYGPYSAYAQSKLANVLFTEALHRRLEGTGITTYSLHPGVVATDLLKIRNKFALALLDLKVVFLFPFKTPWQGAQTSLYTAIAPGIEKDSGCYFADCQVTDNPNPLYRNEEIADDLWKLSEELVKQKWDDLPID